MNEKCAFWMECFFFKKKKKEIPNCRIPECFFFINNKKDKRKLEMVVIVYSYFPYLWTNERIVNFFNEGLSYREISYVLAHEYDIYLSVRQIHRVLRSQGLRRRTYTDIRTVIDFILNWRTRDVWKTSWISNLKAKVYSTWFTGSCCWRAMHPPIMWSRR